MDYQLWIDSDIVFDTTKFWQLCDMALAEDGTEKEIVSGWYCTEDGKTTSCAHWLEEEDFRKSGGVMNHETLESISKRRKPFTVDYIGFGWCMIKKGVFEHGEMKYPWFAPKMQEFESGEVQDMCGEDVSFCLDAIAAGFDIWVDPRIRVGHEKNSGDLMGFRIQLYKSDYIIDNQEEIYQESLLVADKVSCLYDGITADTRKGVYKKIPESINVTWLYPVYNVFGAAAPSLHFL